MHSLPHDPQSDMLVLRSTQSSPQRVVPLVAQAGPHRAFTQISWLPHARLQTPQWFLSLMRSAQVLPQRVSPPVHVEPGVTSTEPLVFEPLPPSRHQEFWQLVPAGQTNPQAPQFRESAVRSRQEPLHRTRPAWQEVRMAATVAVVGAGTVIVVPAVAGADVASGAGDDPPAFPPCDPLNVPRIQVSPYGTEKPHPPQFSPSVWRSTQVPLHRVMFAEHWPVAGPVPESLNPLALDGVPAGSR